MNAVPSTLVTVAHKKIKVKSLNDVHARELEKTLGIHPVIARILAARNFSAGKQLEDFLEPTLRDGLPRPDGCRNLGEGAAFIAQAIRNNEKIAIACDFDVDGLSGGAQAFHFLKTVGVDVEIFVPDRFKDGYGLNLDIIKQAHAQQRTMLLTIDYGTTNVTEIEHARSLGMKTVVIDHHHVGDTRAQPDVFINPNQDGCGFAEKILCASGLVWYLLTALKKVVPQAASIDLKDYLDLACLGTICDMVPLVGANRVIAKRGLEVLTNTKRVGLTALKNVAGIKGTVTCHDVGFGIGPRINAAGRMVHGNVVIDLLTTDDSALAEKIAARLNRLNSERQDTENLVKEKAIKLIRQRGILEAGLVVWDEEFHTGVVGIVAQRLVEQFYRPAVVMGVDKDGTYKGSVRGIKGFNVVEALHAVGDTMVKFGGHSGAGGLSVLPDMLPEFVERFKLECMRRLATIETEPIVEADTTVELDELDLSLCTEIQKFAPFGMGNPTPVLMARGLRVLDLTVIKHSHLKMTLTNGKTHLSGMFWRHNAHPCIAPGAEVDVAFKLDKSSFNGRTSLQATIQAAANGSRK